MKIGLLFFRSYYPGTWYFIYLVKKKDILYLVQSINSSKAVFAVVPRISNLEQRKELPDG